MNGPFFTVYRSGSGEYVEKKSRFLAEVVHVETEEEAEAFLRARRKKYYDARHHCSAYLVGENPEIVRSSDDGEPSGSAGRPILSVLEGANLHNTIAVVTRYFGGTLLGVGGLVRSYQAAVKDALEHAEIMELREGCEITVRCDYSDDGKLKYEFASRGITVADTVYGEAVTTTVLLPAEQSDPVQKMIRELTSARCEFLSVKDISYGLVNGKPVLL